MNTPTVSIDFRFSTFLTFPPIKFITTDY
ncbi:hypothetical protein CCUS01_02302 [Colletotrichum cuscutae]|uniref:Uncharacterized protein n=1 Tax=Colletotrichum cuscutae TaxID=1209917 RepID=A0AAI9TZD1_9PEZI|nr:hypothetical protein CCUS01_02302 [Colletotrichum cuscutae]